MWPACFRTDTEAVIPLGLAYVSRLQIDHLRAHFSEQSHFTFKQGPHFLTLLQDSNLFSILLQQASQFQGHTRPQHYLSLDFHRRNTRLRNPTSWASILQTIPKSSPRIQCPHHPFSPGFTVFPVQSGWSQDQQQYPHFLTRLLFCSIC